MDISLKMLKIKLYLYKLGFVGKIFGFFTGLPSTQSMNAVTLFNLLHIFLCFSIIILVNVINKHYLKKRLVRVLQAEERQASEQVVNNKVLIFVFFLCMIMFLSMVLYQKYAVNNIPMGMLLTPCCLSVFNTR